MVVEFTKFVAGPHGVGVGVGGIVAVAVAVAVAVGVGDGVPHGQVNNWFSGVPVKPPTAVERPPTE